MEAYKSVVLDTIRALKKIEWAGKLDDVCWECCLFCEGMKTGPACKVLIISSRCCERGTRSCIVSHDRDGHLHDCEFVRLLAAAQEVSE